MPGTCRMPPPGATTPEVSRPQSRGPEVRATPLYHHSGRPSIRFAAAPNASENQSGKTAELRRAKDGSDETIRKGARLARCMSSSGARAREDGTALGYAPFRTSYRSNRQFGRRDGWLFPEVLVLDMHR